MRIGIPKERLDGEMRVAATPTTVSQLIKLGFEVDIEKGAGQLSNFSDEDYETAGSFANDYYSIMESHRGSMYWGEGKYIVS